MSRTPRMHLLLIATLAGSLGTTAHAARFTYHGDLMDGDRPAHGRYDLRVRALAAPGAKQALAEPTELPDVRVIDGRFSVELELPEAAGDTTWVEVAVRADDASAYEVLGEPQAIGKANSTCPGAWALDGNTGMPAGSFLGLADAMSPATLELRARNAAVARFTPAGDPSDFGDAPRVVLGSSGNVASGPGSTIGGGGATRNGAGNACPLCVNTASGAFGTISGGSTNTASHGFSTVGGGTRNLAGGTWATVGGGTSNRATGAEAATVAGGESNDATGFISTVGGGSSNDATGGFTIVAGGQENTASGAHASIGGGRLNEASGESTHVGGGRSNAASGQFATLAGGLQNFATGFASTVSGGQDNIASHIGATVAGGFNNAATGSHSLASGYSSCAGGDRSVALGDKARVRPGNDPDDLTCGSADTSGDSDGDEGTFVFADSSAMGFRSSGSNQFNVRARGGVGINTAPPNATIEMTIQADADDGDYANLWLKQKSANANGLMLSVGDGGGTNNASFYIDHFSGSAQARRMELLGTGAVTIRSNVTQANTGVTMAANAGSWSSLSDRRLKTAIELVDAGAILDRLLATPISTWSYIAQGEGVRHIGPMAQDFAQAFGLGENDTTISTIDADGVALAAIQGLNARLERDRARLERRNLELQSRLDALLARVTALESAR